MILSPQSPLPALYQLFEFYELLIIVRIMDHREQPQSPRNAHISESFVKTVTIRLCRDLFMYKERYLQSAGQVLDAWVPNCGQGGGKLNWGGGGDSKSSTIFYSIYFCMCLCCWCLVNCDYNRDFHGLRDRNTHLSPPVSGDCGRFLMTTYVKMTHPQYDSLAPRDWDGLARHFKDEIFKSFESRNKMT